jgi:acetoin utilization protein AcuC
VRVVPRAWTHLLASVAGHDLDPGGRLPEEWIATAAMARPVVVLRGDWNEGTTSLVEFDRWDGTQEMAVDRAIQETRNKLYPLHGLDPHDPRD